MSCDTNLPSFAARSSVFSSLTSIPDSNKRQSDSAMRLRHEQPTDHCGAAGKLEPCDNCPCGQITLRRDGVQRKLRWVQTRRVVGLQSGNSSRSYSEYLPGESLIALTVVYVLVHPQAPGRTYSSREAETGLVIHVASGAGAADPAFGEPWILILQLGQAVGDHRNRDWVRLRQLSMCTSARHGRFLPPPCP